MLVQPFKNKRDFTIVEILEKTLELVPIERRGGVSIECCTSQKILRDNLEAIYSLATQRILHLSYYLEWSRTFENNERIKPTTLNYSALDYISAQFHEFDSMPEKNVVFFNTSFAKWINHQVVRELNEFLKGYLLELYETCTALEHTKAPITPKGIVYMRRECQAFEKAGMKDRLRMLRKNFGFQITHNREILSLCEVRNIFSHSDGVVTKKFCNGNDYIEVIWPQNICRVKKRGKDEWIPYRKIQKPISSALYESIQIKWLAKPEVRRYALQTQINLTHKDLNDLIVFHLYVFNELHGKLIQIVEAYNIKVKPFKEYITSFEGISFLTDE